MSVHIHVVTPIFASGLTQDADFEGILSADDRVTFTELQSGPLSVECAFDAALAAPEAIARAIEAEDAGADAVVIDCMEEPGFEAMRECLEIPVLGPCQSSMAVASMLGHKFSMLSVSGRMAASFERKAQVYGAVNQYASTRSVEIPVSELHAASQNLRGKLLEQGLSAIKEDGAEVLILACTGMTGVAEHLQRELREAGYGVPVIDPIVVTIRMAKALAQSGLHHAKLSSAWPETKERRGFDHEAFKRFSRTS